MKRKILKPILTLIFVVFVYVAGSLLWATASDYQPPLEENLILEGNTNASLVDKDTLSFYSWNLGYGGLGEESDFFYDGGRTFLAGDNMVRSPEVYVDKNILGIRNTLAKQDADFLLLQEVDRYSTRSYYKDQYKIIQGDLPKYSSAFAKNFSVTWIPIPILEPWNVMGKMECGIANYCKYKPLSSQRFQLPGSYDWPTNVFQLDRCLMMQKYKTTSGKDLVVINVHFSAYDKGGFMKSQQLQFLEKLVKEEYAKGAYVVVGGDWNQVPENIRSVDGLSNWVVVSEMNKTTVRSLRDPFDMHKTKQKLIDYFLISPNVQLVSNATNKMNFKYSDHEGVMMTVAL